MIALEKKNIYQNLAKGLKLETRLPETYFKDYNRKTFVAQSPCLHQWIDKAAGAITVKGKAFVFSPKAVQASTSQSTMAELTEKYPKNNNFCQNKITMTIEVERT